VVAGVTLLLGALGIELWFLSHRHKAVASPSPALAEASPLVPPPPTTIPEEVTVVTRPQEQPTLGPPAVQPTAAAPPGVIAPMGGLPTPPVVAPTVPTAPPTVAPATTATRPPVVAATPPPPPPTNPVPGLLAEAERAISARRFDEAISRFNEVLNLDPQNSEATTVRLRAMGERASAGRFFLTAVTVSEGKASSGGIKGFEGGQVVKSQCECALMYEVSPPNPAQGQPYSVSIFMRNDSKKDIKPQSLSVVVTVNGTPSARKVALAATEVAKGQRAMVGKLDDTWKVGTTSWSLEAAVGAGGNTYRAQLTWELRVPAGQ